MLSNLLVNLIIQLRLLKVFIWPANEAEGRKVDFFERLSILLNMYLLLNEFIKTSPNYTIRFINFHYELRFHVPNEDKYWM